MWLARIDVQGFKALDRFSINLTNGLTALVGKNGAGKSSVLQLLDFVFHFANGNAADFFEQRGWDPRTTHSMFSLGRIVGVQLAFQRDNDTRLIWKFNWGAQSGRNRYESVSLEGGAHSPPSKSLEYVDGQLFLNGQIVPLFLRLQGSILSILDDKISRQIKDFDPSELFALRDWLRGILSLELLSPAGMKSGSRGNKKHIGQYGQHLPSFLANLKAEQKKRLMGRLEAFFPNLRNIDTIKKRAGWVQMKIAEKYRKIQQVDVNHSSDGFLRLLAFCTIPEFDPSIRLVLLDEIEDGIDPHVIPSLLSELRDSGKRQVVVTSHSPLLINLIKESEIVLLARDEAGRSVAASYDSTELGAKFKRLGFGPGEVWSHSSLKAVESAIRQTSLTKSERFQDLLVRPGGGSRVFRVPRPRQRMFEFLEKPEK